MKLRTLLIITCFAISLIPVMIIGGIQGFESSSMLLISIILFVTLSFSIVLSYLISKSIEKLTMHIDELSKGKLDVQLEKSEIYEINQLTNSLNRIMASLKLAIHKVGVKKGEIFEETVKAKEDVEEKYGDLLDSIAGWAWETDSKGIITFCSKNVLYALGYKPGDLMGKSIFKFMPLDKVKGSRRIFKEAGGKNKSIKNLENWYLSKTGKKICMLTNSIPFYDNDENLLGYRGVDIDITQSKLSDEKIKELNKEMDDLKDRIAQLLNERRKKPGRRFVSIEKKFEERWSEYEFDSVFLFDENADILDCNENMYKKLGYTKGEILSLDISDFDILESKKDILNKMQEAKKKGSISFKSIHKRKDGTSVLVYENMQYLKDKNMFKCIAREDYSFKK